MKKIFLYLFLSSFACSCRAQADSLLAQKYLPDSLHFQSFPQAFLLDSIRPAKKYPVLELNTLLNRGEYRNRYRSNGRKDIPDTVVLSKARGGFYTFCPPGGCGWYISAQKGKKIITIENLTALDNFIGTIDNKYDAYLWLVAQDLADSRFVPIQTKPAIEYKLVDGGYLIRFVMRIRDCPVTSGKVTWFVGSDKKIVLIKKEILEIGEGCI